MGIVGAKPIVAAGLLKHSRIVGAKLIVNCYS